MLRKRGLVTLGWTALVALSFVTGAFAGELTGSVRTAGGKPVLGALVTLTRADGLFVESLMAAIAQGDEAAKSRVRAFLEGRAAKVGKS